MQSYENIESAHESNQISCRHLKYATTYIALSLSFGGLAIYSALDFNSATDEERKDGVVLLTALYSSLFSLSTLKQGLGHLRSSFFYRRFEQEEYEPLLEAPSP